MKQYDADVAIIGAGVGGLSCGALLAKRGKKVLAVEKIHHIGGTSHIFTRKRNGKYFYPMGPLSFSHPDKVNSMLSEMGVNAEIKFKRSHFQLITPDIDIIYSQSLNTFQEDLKTRFPEDKEGIYKVFKILKNIINAIERVEEWHPEYTSSSSFSSDNTSIPEKYRDQYKIIKKYSEISSKKILDKYLSNNTLKKLLGSQGTYQPIMNMVHLAFMWNVMSEKGIWYPLIGIYGINELLKDIIVQNKGEILLNTPVKEILIKNGEAIGIEAENGRRFKANWIVSNADYKTTFLNLIRAENVPNDHLQVIQESTYTGSEFCVYLAADRNKVDPSKLRAPHVFYRQNTDRSSDGERKSKNFDKKEIEICVWSEKEPDSAPEGFLSLILRVNMDFDLFKPWRTGMKQRKEGYYEYKERLAIQLIKVVDNIIPGFLNAYTIIDIATPLTYLDWGKRFRGSVAGWSRDLEKVKGFKSKILVETPIDRLFVVGIYSFLEPFLGGYPVSMYSGKLAAEYILKY